MNDVKCLRDDLNSVVMFFHPIGKDFKCGSKTVDTFLALLKGVPDFRDPMKIKYKLENLLFICFYLALKGEFTSFYHAATYVEVKQEWFIERGLVKEGELPSHDTFMRIFQYLDANGLRDTFLNKIKYLTERLIEIDQSAKDKHKLISGDGKEIKGSGRSGRFYNINMFNCSVRFFRKANPVLPAWIVDSCIRGRSWQNPIPFLNIDTQGDTVSIFERLDLN